MEITKELLTVANYARLKNVATITVYRWIKEGKIQLVEVDGVKFIQVQ